MRKIFCITLILVVGVFTLPVNTLAIGMSSSNYKIEWDSFNSGGDDNATSASYQLFDTIGQTAPGVASSASYKLRAGYQQVGIDSLNLEMIVSAQDASTKIDYSAFNSSGFTVTLSDSSSYLVGQVVVVVENEGENQMIAIGQVTDNTANVLTVDKWSGDHAVMSASPIGSNDYVYAMTSSAVALGTQDTSTVSTATSYIEISTNLSTGYNCDLSEVDGFQNASLDVLDDVFDGNVTAGSEEYGVEKTGDNAQGTGTDVAITSTPTAVMTSTTFASEDRTGVIYKLAISAATKAGQYTHTARHTCATNF